MEESESGKWKASSCLLGVLIFAMASIGARNEGCDYRYVLDPDDSNNPLELSQTETDEANFGPLDDELGWVADDMSRLVLYSWTSYYSVLPFSSLAQAFDHVAAYESGWVAVWGEDDDVVELGIPSVCGPDGCARWYHVKSVDIGYCSLPIGNDASSVYSGDSASILRDLDLHTLEFPEAFLAELVPFLHELRVYDEGEQGGAQGVEGEDYLVLNVNDSLKYLQFFTGPADASWWKSADQEDDLCFNVDFRYNAKVDGTPNCRTKDGWLAFCGHLDEDGNQGVKWVTTKAAAWSENRTGVICGQVDDAVEDALVDILMDSSAENPISDKVGDVISERLSIDGDDAALLNVLTCTDDSDCVDFFGLVNGRCRTTENHCRWSIPVERVERMPSGHELILAEEEKLGSGVTNEFVATLRLLHFGDNGSLGGRLFHQQCAEPADFDETSNNYGETVVFRQGEWLNRFNYTHDYRQPDEDL